MRRRHMGWWREVVRLANRAGCQSDCGVASSCWPAHLLAAIQQQANELSAPFLLQTVHASRTVMRSPAAEWFKLVCRHGACLCHAECVLLDSPGQSSLIVWQRCRQQQPPRQSQKWNRDHIACRSICSRPAGGRPFGAMMRPASVHDREAAWAAQIAPPPAWAHAWVVG